MNTALQLFWPLAIRYALALILVGVGALKFTGHEAEAIRPLAEKSPVLGWSLGYLSIRMFSALIGTIEIATGILIALRPVYPKLSLIGSAGAAITFCVILSFMASSPGQLDKGLSIPFIPDSAVQFLITHLLLLCAALFTVYDALLPSKGTLCHY